MNHRERKFHEEMKPFMEQFQKNLDKWAEEHPEEYEAMFYEDDDETPILIEGASSKLNQH